MAEGVDELDLEIEDYLDGRMPPEKKQAFEDRMRADAKLRERVLSTTKSVALMQQALGGLTPGDDFDDKVNSKIISITQSGQNIRPPVRASTDPLTAKDPDAKLLHDPDAARERRRLIVLGLIAALVFALAVGTIGWLLLKH